MRKKIPSDTEDGFLSRWSSRKQQADNPPAPAGQGVEANQPAVAAPQSDPVPQNRDATGERDDAPVLTDEDMPDIETLDESSDFSAFLSPGVSDELRRLALRKLFRSQVFNVRDGLDDYDDDFRRFTALGDMITSDMKHQLELAEQKRQAAQADQPPSPMDDTPASGENDQDEQQGDDQDATADQHAVDESQQSEADAETETADPDSGSNPQLRDAQA